MLWLRFGPAFEPAGQEHTVAPSRMVAPIPMRVLSSTVAAWMMAPCPAAQRSHLSAQGSHLPSFGSMCSCYAVRSAKPYADGRTSAALMVMALCMGEVSLTCSSAELGGTRGKRLTDGDIVAYDGGYNIALWIVPSYVHRHSILNVAVAANLDAVDITCSRGQAWILIGGNGKH